MINQEVEVKHNLNYLLKCNGNARQVINVHDMPSYNHSSVWCEGNFVSPQTLGMQVGSIISGEKDCCVKSSKSEGVRKMFSLENIIAENPTLTGPEAQELLRKSIEVENIKYKSELQDKLVELSKLENLYYKVKNYNEVSICKVTKFTIEYNTLYIYMDCITKNNSGRIYASTEPVRYDYAYFCGLDVEEANGELYKNMMNYFVFVENNLK